MPNYDELLQASLPEALDAAIETINFEHEDLDSLLEANVAEFEGLNFCVFGYFNRKDVFYLNRAGRRLLEIYQSPFEPSRSVSKPTFSLGLDPFHACDDRDVIETCRPKHHVKELISLTWGDTWLRGSKYPIRSTAGLTMAILFAGREMLGSEQIQHASFRHKAFQHQCGEN